MIQAYRRFAALAIATALIAAACSSTGSTSSPSAASSAAPSAAQSVAGSTATDGSASPAASDSGSPAASGSVACATGSITAAGSTALQPLVDAAAKQYAKTCSGATINVQGGGSGTGLSQVASGAVQLGDSDVTAESKLKAEDAAKLVDHIVAKQGWIMVVNKSVTGVTNLTTQQAKDIWTGKITNWKDVGGPDQPVVLIIRPASSGTRATFKKIVLGGASEATGQTIQQDSNGAVTTAVEQTAGSTSVIGFAYYADNKDKLTGLQLDGIDATVANISNGSYKLAAEGHIYTNGQPSGLTAAFLDYLVSADVQQNLIPSLNYGSVK